MDKSDVWELIERIPGLNSFGVGVYDERRLSPEEAARKRARGVESLLRCVDACNLTIDWLAQIEKTRAINRRHSSYGLKHIAEKDIGYVTNGAFIAAAIFAGFPYEVVAGNPNVLFGMSEKSLKAVMSRQNVEKKANWAF